MLGFLAGAVEHRPRGTRHVGGGLQQQRRFTDAGLAAEQDHRSRHDAAAQHAIELVDRRRQPRMLRELDVGIQPRAGRGTGARIAMRCRRPLTAGRALLDDRAPCATLEAAPQPFGRLRAALLTDEDGFGRFGHLVVWLSGH